MKQPAPWKKPDPLPGPVLTARTVVRWWQASDAEGLHLAVAGDRDALLPWLPWAEREHATVEESGQIIDRFTRDRNFPEALDFVMGIFERDGGRVLGGTGIHRIEPEHRTGEIGYWIRGSRQREGYCTEAVGGLITAAFDAWGFHRIKICCAGRNVPSQRVPEKLGLRLEGRERNARWLPDDGWDDHLTYAVLADEWDGDAGRVRTA